MERFLRRPSGANVIGFGTSFQWFVPPANSIIPSGFFHYSITPLLRSPITPFSPTCAHDRSATSHNSLPLAFGLRNRR